MSLTGSSLEKKAATYSPALHRSTIGAGGLNFSVRDGKRWGPAAITTSKGGHADTQQDNSGKHAVTIESTTHAGSLRAISSARL